MIVQDKEIQFKYLGQVYDTIFQLPFNIPGATILKNEFGCYFSISLVNCQHIILEIDEGIMYRLLRRTQKTLDCIVDGVEQEITLG